MQRNFLHPRPRLRQEPPASFVLFHRLERPEPELGGCGCAVWLEHEEVMGERGGLVACGPGHLGTWQLGSGQRSAGPLRPSPPSLLHFSMVSACLSFVFVRARPLCCGVRRVDVASPSLVAAGRYAAVTPGRPSPCTRRHHANFGGPSAGPPAAPASALT
eukprot:358873-Chlamydomonas_euryale.AAC.4